MRAKGRVGEPLPTPFSQLAALRAFARRGQMGLTAAASGGGKTAFWCHWVMNGRYDDIYPIPTLYFSSDSDTATVGVRTAQGVFGCTQDEAEKRLAEPGGWEAFHEATEHVWWDFQVAPTLEHMNEEIEAYAIANGEYPHLIVVDNLMDVDSGYGADEGSNQREALLWGASKARETGAHVHFLHHVTGENVNGDRPIGKRDILNKVDKRPRIIYTAWQDPEMPGYLQLSVIKNSNGSAKSDGSLYVSIPWLPERAWMG
ncbi:AAA family ATPase [Micromonospora sp. CB01531]|uniref:AAA family ATPase n=1 Tax=Micromonospora sp. CB01531 TaxID=1718947 RepID=UPI00093B06F8|nr:AAA family ATPase [Micromonospora sp. CB01531]